MTYFDINLDDFSKFYLQKLSDVELIELKDKILKMCFNENCE